MTDSNGYATIPLPTYFEAINRDFRYNLTVVSRGGDDFVFVRVVEEIKDSQFTIRTSHPYVKISWEVKGVRNDPWIRKHGFQVEQEKPNEHRGKYLHPELFGFGPERGVFYRPGDPTMPPAKR